MKNENTNHVMAALLDAGGVKLTLEVAGYAYTDGGGGSDADWLRACILVRSDELIVRRSFFTLAPIQTWLDSLARVITGTSSHATISNTEEDFELVVEREGGDLRVVFTVAVLSRPPCGRVLLTLPIAMSSLESFHEAMLEIGWVYPKRSE